MIHSLFTSLNEILTVPSSDPDDARRRKLLNIILAGVLVLAVITLLLTILFDIFSQSILEEDALVIYVASIALIAGAFLFYGINRYIAGWFASTLFIIFLMVVFAFSDTPTEVANGRSLFVFTIPIVISSVLLPPYACFIFSFISSIEIAVLARVANLETNIIAIAGFFMLALVSWLSSRSLEQALKELREININLDNLVEQRTQELANSLSRELVLAGRNQAVLESITDGVIVFDTQGTAIQANPALSNLLTVPLNNIISAGINDLVESSPMDAMNKDLLAGLLTKPDKSSSSHRVEWGQKTISVSSGQVFDFEGGEIGTVAVFRDFTKEAEVERMKSAFVAMVSHELRTPLSAVFGYAEMLKEGIYGVVTDKQKLIAERVMSNTQRLLGLINDLLDQAQMEAGKLKIQQEIIQPAVLLGNLHSVMEKIATDKGLEFVTEYDNNLPQEFIGDSARIQQIMVNLASNAVKFTETGKVSVSLACISENKKWQIVVEDTGKGISESALPHIFETFRQVEGATTRVHGGFGLGLSIVKQLANLMGGEVVVKSKVGEGSLFTVRLPLILPMNEEKSNE